MGNDTTGSDRTVDERLAAIELQLQGLMRAVGRIEGGIHTVRVFAIGVSGTIAALVSAAFAFLGWLQ